MIHAERIRNLNGEESDLRGSYVVYWMQASVRSHWNHALEYAIETANSLKKPLIVVLVLQMISQMPIPAITVSSLRVSGM